MRLRLLIAAPLALAAMAVGPATAGAQTGDSPCYWLGGNQPGGINIAYPDEGAKYVTGGLLLPPGVELVIRGEFPHARYMSFNVYDPLLRPTDALADVRITPDPGSSNPFLPGADRGATQRSYTVRVVSGVAPDPSQRAPNTIYLSAAGQASIAGAIIYRVYVPDQGGDALGGTGFPDVSLRLPGGLEIPAPQLCTGGSAYAGLLNQINELLTSSELSIPTPAQRLAEDPPRWEAFFNVFYTLGGELQGTPLETLRGLIPYDGSGGFLSNVDNAYVYANVSRSKGPLLVIEGKAPSFPRTRSGEGTMGSGQLRYWSLCQNERYTQRFVDCLIDEDIPQRDGRYTVVVGAASERPANATDECGVGFLRWGAFQEGLVILRNMLPSNAFAEAIQRVETPGQEAQVMGAYLPRGSYTNRADFETRGCTPPSAPLSAAGAAAGKAAKKKKKKCRKGRKLQVVKAKRKCVKRKKKVGVGL